MSPGDIEVGSCPTLRSVSMARDAMGKLVITNPATGTGLPRAALARGDVLEAALNRTRKRITIDVRVVDTHSSRPFHDILTFVVGIS